MNPFEVLGFSPGYDIAADQLARRHRELSKVLHPDKFTGSGGGERREALSRAVEVNEAFRILRDPVRRAEAIFSLSGIAVGETNEPKAAPNFLMEVMEQREALEDAKASGDTAAVRALGDGIAAQTTRVVEELGQGFASAQGDAEKLRALLPLLGKLRYARRFQEELEALLEES
jgi:molecular chaperone HscB